MRQCPAPFSTSRGSPVKRDTAAADWQRSIQFFTTALKPCRKLLTPVETPVRCPSRERWPGEVQLSRAWSVATNENPSWAHLSIPAVPASPHNPILTSRSSPTPRNAGRRKSVASFITSDHRRTAGIHRRAKLWPETVQAITAWQAERSNNDAGRVFARNNEGIVRDVAKLLHKLEINGRKHPGFYSLRHTFRTIGEETRDFPAVQLAMGHSNNTMASHYRERISDDRLEAVAGHVRKWRCGADKSQ